MAGWTILERQTDRQDKSARLSCLFTYRKNNRTAGGGAFLQGYHALWDALLPGGLFNFRKGQEGKNMDAVIYTEDDREYEMLSAALADESPGATVTRGVLDGHFHLGERYDVAVVDMDGAQGMELVCKYRELYGGTLVIWITDDSYFAGVAIRTHIFDFLVRPLTELRFRESLRRIREGDIALWQRMPAEEQAYQPTIPCDGNVPERKGISPKNTRRNGTLWEKIRNGFLSESSL